ncbi:MAG: phosphoribosyltransferase [Candidatus Elarobacter sp.]
MTAFPDRRAAGRSLVRRVMPHVAPGADVVVLALPRGGVPVGFEVARVLRAPLDVFVVRKLGVPGHEELAMGAIASGGVRVLNDDVVTELRIAQHVLESATRREATELARRERLYRGDRALQNVAGRTVVLVDDGLATGASMRAAIGALRALRPARIIAAVPVGAAEVCRALAGVADTMLCEVMPAEFVSVGTWYDDFTQTTDDDVRALLAASVLEAP